MAKNGFWGIRGEVGALGAKVVAGVVTPDGRANLAQHRKRCTVCHHREREEIEREFLDWVSAETIRKRYRLGDRSAVYRHAHAFRLFEGRRRNLRIVLERILERGGDVRPTASAVISAARALAKINVLGEWFEREDHRVYLQRMFDQMTKDELEAYAREGTVPERFGERASEARVLAATTAGEEDAGSASPGDGVGGPVASR